MSVGAVFYAVVYEDARPPVPPEMPAPYLALMQECWSADAVKRPTFPVVQARAVSALSVSTRSLTVVASSHTKNIAGGTRVCFYHTAMMFQDVCKNVYGAHRRPVQARLLA